jgi:spore coat protein I
LNNNIETENDLKLLATQVLQQYDIIPSSISIIQSGSIKTVWKIVANNKVYCLKRLKQTLDKVLFSVNAQIYIKETGGNVPGIYLDVNGEPIVSYNDQLFVNYEWLNGRDLNFTSTKDFSQAIGGLARFHASSKGYTAKTGARISTKLGKWPNQYESMRKKMLTWKETAKTIGTSQHLTYIKYVDSIADIAQQAKMLLENSEYISLTSETSKVPVLCHQDFGKGNALLKDNNEVFVIDLDGVTFDLPSSDLRKIIGKIAENTGRWDTKSISDILNWYSSVNPVTDEEKKILYIDLLFPHWFFGLVKNQYINMKALKASEIERIAKLEMSKVQILKELI